MTVKKRSHQYSQGTSKRRDLSRNIPTHIRTVFVEQGDDLTRKQKHPKKNDPLNLLIQAIVAEKVRPLDRDNIRYRGRKSEKSFPALARRISSTRLISKTNKATFGARKLIVDRVPPDLIVPDIIPKDDCLSSAKSSSSLPRGRPLMAPPRLPTKLIPRFRA